MPSLLRTTLALAAAFGITMTSTAASEPAPAAAVDGIADAIARLERDFASTCGDGVRGRAARGLRQAAAAWRAEDGDAAAFEAFAREHFAGTPAAVDALFARFERILEQVEGHLAEIDRALSWEVDLERGPLAPIDPLFAGYEPGAHISDDLFKTKIAFAALLNFRLTTLHERLAEGEHWTRRQWAEARLAQRFSKRVPAAVRLDEARMVAAADIYISTYDIWMHHLVDEAGTRLFPAGMRLLSHWGLRDEIKAAYADPVHGLAKQRTIAQVMDRIVTQTIPGCVAGNSGVDWDPFANTVAPAAVADGPAAAAGAPPSTAPEPDTRYAMLLRTFHAARLADPYSPTAPTLIARRFDEDRELPEPRVRAMLEQILGSPLAPEVARLIERRLGRPLEPFDIWYDGFRLEGAVAPAELDRVTAAKYPTAAAFEQDLPNLLGRLGFPPDRAAFLARNIAVDAARGSGHASGGAMRGALARLRTRVGAGGMDYQGFNVAAHELGHNVEQVFSLNGVDHWLLQGVPNTAFTEAIAFVFQARDFALLGLDRERSPRAEALSALDAFWSAFEIAGVALIDIEIWHWMYAHPEATPAQLRDAVLGIAKDTWNRWHAPVFGRRDVPLLAIYAHLLRYQLYTPDYAIGSCIAFQIEEHLRSANGAIGPEIERMTSFGAVAPDLWMKNATGAPVGADALLAAAARALAAIEAR